MSSKTLIDQIRHYQKDIERCPDNAERMIRCIQRLYVLPIHVEHLQETGIGRSVNALRKYNGEVGDAAKALVAKWKAMVAAEESSDGEIPQVQEESPSSPINLKPLKPSLLKDKVIPSETFHLSSSSKHHNLSQVSSKHKESSTYKESSKEKSHSHEKHLSRERNEAPRVIHHKNKDSYREKRKIDIDSDENTSRKKMKRSHQIKEEYNYSRKHKEESSEEESEEETVNTADKTDPSVEDNSEEDYEEENEIEESNIESEQGDSNSDESDVESSPRQSKQSSEESEEEIEIKHTDRRHHTKHKHSHRQSSHSSSNKHGSHSSHSSKSHSKSSHEDKEKNYGTHEKKRSKDRDKQKDSHKHSSKHRDMHSSYKSVHLSSQNISDLIKENEKKIKQEKGSDASPKKETKSSNKSKESHKPNDYHKPKEASKIKSEYSPKKSSKSKIETNEDGSIDNECGASFGDALMGFDMPVKKKKKILEKPEKVAAPIVEKPEKTAAPTLDPKKSKVSLSTPSSHSKSSNSTELFKQPELLLKKPKEEPLDIDFSSTLPEISPNYKPLPYVPEHVRKPVKSMSEEDTMFSIMTTKNQRTKVFSGNKSTTSEVPSLYNMCIQLLYDNIDAVEYTGGVPYDLLEPLLKKLNADQLYLFEHFNDYLIPDTAQLWEFHCKKDFRNEKRIEMESWRELYVRCVEERERKLKALTANISQSMAKSTPVRQTKLAYVDAVPRKTFKKKVKLISDCPHSPVNGAPSASNKKEILGKALVGGHTPGVQAEDVVPAPPMPRPRISDPVATQKKKKKAPLMAKALQLIKGNRFKR